MKTMILSALLLGSMIYSQALKKGDYIILKTDTKVEDNVIIMNDAPGTPATHLEEGIKFTVLEVANGKTKLKVYRNYPTKGKKGKLYNSKIYTISDIDLTDNYKKYEPEERISVGIITLPFKYRPQKEESFETEFNINTTLNVYLFTIGRGSANLQFGTGFGSIRLDELNSSLLAENAVNAITLGFIAGPMFRYKKIQYGFYTGFDIINNNSKLKWTHNGKLWLGMGVGFKLFTLNNGD